GYRLSVDGNIICEELLVQLSGDWPDYVFADGYQTPDLKAWAKHIKEKRHLPGIPSAAEVAARGGIDVGETNRLLLEKVEQLTLLLIDQQNQIDALKASLNK
ncbi:MAG: hypothetical protein AAF840_10960, partial [Bacteroidota bacterium]